MQLWIAAANKTSSALCWRICCPLLRETIVVLMFKLLLSVLKLHKIHSYKISVSFGGMLDMVELLLQTKSWCAFEAFVFLSWERQSLCVCPNCCFLLFNLPYLELQTVKKSSTSQQPPA
jgi:hypothetical protein